MISAQNLTKNFGRKAILRGISLHADPGQITLMVGPNGAGKSTTVKVLAGLIRPNGGMARVNGFDIVQQRISAQRATAYLPQRPSFHPKLTCLEILRFYAGLRGVPASRSEAMLQLTGLGDVARVGTEKLSGGMRQLLGIAFLLLADAPVLLLDEPGLSLDPGWRKWLQQKLRFEAERGKTILVTTHLIAEWNDVADRCLLCRDGIIERELDPKSLPTDFDELENPSVSHATAGQPYLGSARAPRAGFGVAPKRTFDSGDLYPSHELHEKSANARTRSPAREARALPRTARQRS
jgi:ABC-type multidrug transport system ATPase subunit